MTMITRRVYRNNMPWIDKNCIAIFSRRTMQNNKRNKNN